MNDQDNVPRPQPELGRMLRQTRLRRGISLHQAEDATKIRTRYLADLERENFDALPAVYMRGSLKTYANFLGLDGEYMARELKRRQKAIAEEPLESLDEPPKGGSTRRLAFLGMPGAGTPGPRDNALPVWMVSSHWYPIPALLLTLVLAGMSLAMALAGEPRRTPISQVREPTLSASPPQVYRVADRETAYHPSRQGDGGNGRDQEEHQAGEGGQSENVAEQGQMGTGSDQPGKPPEAPVTASASVSTEPSPKPRPGRGPGSDAPAPTGPEPRPEPSAEPVAEILRGGRDGGVNTGITTGTIAGSVMVKAGGVRISIPDPGSGSGPAEDRRTGGAARSPEIPPLPRYSHRSPRIRDHQPAPATTPR